MTIATCDGKKVIYIIRQKEEKERQRQRERNKGMGLGHSIQGQDLMTMEPCTSPQLPKVPPSSARAKRLTDDSNHSMPLGIRIHFSNIVNNSKSRVLLKNQEKVCDYRKVTDFSSWLHSGLLDMCSVTLEI